MRAARKGAEGGVSLTAKAVRHTEPDRSQQNGRHAPYGDKAHDQSPQHGGGRSVGEQARLSKAALFDHSEFIFRRGRPGSWGPGRGGGRGDLRLARLRAFSNHVI
eukprot:scaffold10032_cov123-Isochrysis_galbana.AAC.1